MKFSLIAVAFTVACATSTVANACQATVMGGCTQEPTHDTSSHMKSQIVNKVEPAKPTTIQARNTSTTKLGSKKANNDNLIQTVNKAVLR